ncbi:biphenyl 2,3-dioxygenase [Aestuariicella hydrocarbonica]|uniref:Biphenyl 2,3-dioxygenase n=1 Tax=Pseudomaricurvus hydrocarbonicus TaxID=1470433 RepID=A0A9E5MKT4_9GAMM|nr:VOC family protein [Aestuariicella hydrocarbonica]NHO65797.1 biphenyl 2,3-dioxygenase [Aestuariicella hydrocarbonica]
MSTKPKFSHVVFQTAQGEAMRNWYSTVLDGHVVFSDEVLSFVTYDEEHHRIALIHPPMEMDRKTETTAAAHHTAYTFANIDDLIARYELLRDQDILPEVCICHGITTSIYYKDPDGNFVELQIDTFENPDDATAYMEGPYYEEDSVGPAFDPEELIEKRREGMTEQQLGDRETWRNSGLGNPLEVLMGPR